MCRIVLNGSPAGSGEWAAGQLFLNGCIPVPFSHSASRSCVTVRVCFENKKRSQDGCVNKGTKPFLQAWKRCKCFSVWFYAFNELEAEASFRFHDQAIQLWLWTMNLYWSFMAQRLGTFTFNCFQFISLAWHGSLLSLMKIRSLRRFLVKSSAELPIQQQISSIRCQKPLIAFFKLLYLLVLCDLFAIQSKLLALICLTAALCCLSVILRIV